MFILGNSDKNLLVDQKTENKYYDETIEIDIHDTNNTHAILASRAKEKSVCLDIGCGAGYTGKLLKEDKNCTVYGIDVDQLAIETALKKGWYKEIYHFSITNQEDSQYQKFFSNSLQFDYIFFADVLEHVPNPGEVLYEFSKKLKPNGKILTSIPNVAHFDISENLVNRTFNYNRVGLLDNTHLRFFTKRSFYEMIDKMNEIYSTSFQVKQIGKTIVDSPGVERYPSLYQIMNEDGEACVLQYVYEISKKQGKVKNSLEQKRDYFDQIEQKLKEGELLLSEKEQLEKEKGKLQEQCNNLENELQISNENYQKIIQSKSWKITAPIRKGMGWLRGVKQQFQKKNKD